MNNLKHRLKNIFSNHNKVFENYFFMTLLQVASPLVGFVIYPYLIRILEPQNYGLYVFSLSISNYVAIFISFGFSWTGVREITLHQENQKEKNRIISEIFFSKFYLLLLVSIIFYFLVLYIPFFTRYWAIFLCCFLQAVISDLFFPVWFFQGIQKMKVVTYIQLFIRILSIPLVFIFVKTNKDVLNYAIITSATAILGALIAVGIMYYKENIRLYFIPFKRLKKCYKEAIPFFLTNTIGAAKREALPIITGSFLSLSDVALYDLANKIVWIPGLLTDKINGALFPEVIKHPEKSRTRKIILSEIYIGLSMIFFVIVASYWLIPILGGKAMTGAYALSCILSIIILTNLLSGACMNFIFIPYKKYYYITQLQIVALFTIFIFCLPVLIWPSVYVIVIAAVLGGIAEVIYSFYRIKQHHMLS